MTPRAIAPLFRYKCFFFINPACPAHVLLLKPRYGTLPFGVLAFLIASNEVEKFLDVDLNFVVFQKELRKKH